MSVTSIGMFRASRQCFRRVKLQIIQVSAASSESSSGGRNSKAQGNGSTHQSVHQGSGEDMVRKFQGGEHQFSSDRAREILAANAECGQLSDHQTHAHEMKQPHTGPVRSHGRDEHVNKYDSHGSVSLHSVMQSNVPEPFKPTRHNPTHLNMPGGGVKLGDKYLADKRVSTHDTKKKFSTSAIEADIKFEFEIASPQGVQGDQCENYKQWFENFQRYGFTSCMDQLQGVQSGRKTIHEVFSEQQELIRQIAENYHRQNAAQQGVQGSAAVDMNYDAADMQGVQGDIPDLTIQELAKLENPCPQGIQGSDCAQFKLWLENCVSYGFGDCEQQLKELKSGRRTLAQIFEEQDRLIKEVVYQYSAQTGAQQDSQNTNPEVSASSNDPKDPKKLSQKDRLKRAIKDYGATVVVFHVGISLVSLGGFYMAVSSGIDVVALLSKLGVSQSILESKVATGASTFAMAYAVHKLFAPVRIAITLTCVPFIVRYLRGIGFLKPPK